MESKNCEMSQEEELVTTSIKLSNVLILDTDASKHI